MFPFPFQLSPSSIYSIFYFHFSFVIYHQFVQKQTWLQCDSIGSVSRYIPHPFPFPSLHSLIHYQAAWSMANSSFSLASNRKLTVGINASMFHLKMIDHLEETVRETSDLSIYWYVIHSDPLKRHLLKIY